MDTKTKTLELRPCGNSQLKLSALGIGCWMFGGTPEDYWGGHSEEDARNLVSTALEYGMNYFDVAEAYNDGRSEEALGRILGNRRSEAIIGTKVLPGNCEPETLRQHCEASLKRLGSDYVDIYMVHWPIRDSSVEEAFATLRDLKKEGKIRAIGVSNFGIQDLGEALGTGTEIDVNQMHYNMLSRGIEVDITPLCIEKKVGIIAYMPLLQGILTGKFKSLDEIPDNRLRTRHFRGDRKDSRHGGPGAEQEVLKALEEIGKIAAEIDATTAQVALGWTAAKSGITCVLAGARTVEQLKSNIKGVCLDLSPEIMKRLDDATAPILEKLGPNPDYWQSEENTRIR